MIKKLLISVFFEQVIELLQFFGGHPCGVSLFVLVDFRVEFQKQAEAFPGNPDFHLAAVFRTNLTCHQTLEQQFIDESGSVAGLGEHAFLDQEHIGRIAFLAS